ncbi:MAG: polyprenol monophosphomannose synthase [Chloroflexota bacterium]|nr:MAG: polyprenol monophosphomannose synthase [Chloroflexota bacterium]
MGIFKNICVVIPTFNEAENISTLIAEIFALPLEGLNVLVVDDNSPDGTGDIVNSLRKEDPDRISIIRRGKKNGLGTAYITGFQQALVKGHDAIIQMDADFSHPPEKILELMEKLNLSDVAIGSRYIPGGSLDVQWPLWRKSLSVFGNLYAKIILRLPVNDATGGFRAWRRETLLGMPLERVRSNGYAFQVEMIYLANKLGYSILEVPFYFADRQWGNSKMSLKIQYEAAYRVWQMIYEYRDLKSLHRSESDPLVM